MPIIPSSPFCLPLVWVGLKKISQQWRDCTHLVSDCLPFRVTTLQKADIGAYRIPGQKIGFAAPFQLYILPRVEFPGQDHYLIDGIMIGNTPVACRTFGIEALMKYKPVTCPPPKKVPVSSPQDQH